MKKIFKELLSVLLIAVMFVGTVSVSGFDFTVSAVEKTYKTGDIIEFGSYPQSKVTDSTTVSKLTKITKNWISYGYYSGTGNSADGQMKPSNYMKYADIMLNGDKYRAVTFSKYRKWETGYTADTSTENTCQDYNGYYINNVYYFKYEPLKWRVLDASAGLIVCNSAIDSQAYNNYSLYSSTNFDYYGNANKTYYASDWKYCSLRAWLNDNFLNTAFTNSQQSQIKTMTRENNSTFDSQNNSKPTSDKITLLSYWDASNPKYGFNNNVSTCDSIRRMQSTDYAKCQGCGCVITTGSDFYGNSGWWLRSPAASYVAAYVHTDGWVSSNFNVDATDIGIVPALNLTDLHNLINNNSGSKSYTDNKSISNANTGNNLKTESNQSTSKSNTTVNDKLSSTAPASAIEMAETTENTLSLGSIDVIADKSTDENYEGGTDSENNAVESSQINNKTLLIISSIAAVTITSAVVLVVYNKKKMNLL